MSPCYHPIPELSVSPLRMPLRWGSATILVCPCGAWQTHNHRPGPWNTDDLEQAVFEAERSIKENL